MKSVACSAVGLNPQRKLDWIEKEYPRQHHGKVVVVVVIPIVVDVPAIVVEVANVHPVTTGRKILLIFIFNTRNRVLRLLRQLANNSLYTLFLEFYLRAPWFLYKDLHQKQARSSISIRDYTLSFSLKNDILVNQARESRRVKP